MDEARRNRDFSKGQVWDPKTDRWLVEIRYPDGKRRRKRLRREGDALRLWSSEQAKIENGTWLEQAPRVVALGVALAQYREYSRVQNRSHNTYVEPVLKMWERELDTKQLLAR